MNKFFSKFNKIYFWQFLGQKSFFYEIELLCTTSEGFLAPCQNSEKSNDPISRKQPVRCEEAKMDRPYFIGSFQPPLWVKQVKLQ